MDKSVPVQQQLACCLAHSELNECLPGANLFVLGILLVHSAYQLIGVLSKVSEPQPLPQS